MDILIKNGRLIDPATQMDDQRDILIENGRIKKIGKNLKPTRPESTHTIDAKGLIITPGLVDMHTHLREPGYEYKETIKTGSMAAASGGFTSIACMANTDPVNDNASVTKYIIHKARQEAVVNIFPVGAITKGLQGVSLAEIGELKESGVIALSDDGKTVKNAELMRRGLEYARSFSLPVICHCEDSDLCRGGVMNEGITSTGLGLRGIMPAAEHIIVARDIALSEWTKHPVHIAHVSTSGSVRIIREAKSRGVLVSAETAPHYFCLTDEAVADFDTSAKVNPPLRTPEDVAAVKEGLKDGTIDVIASDHAPHARIEKNIEFDRAAFGIAGLETSLPLTLSLVHDKVLTLNQAIEKYTVNPAEILKINKGHICVGADADLTIIDTTAEFTVDQNNFKSKSINTPFHGWKLKGRAVYTIVSGKIVFSLNPDSGLDS